MQRIIRVKAYKVTKTDNGRRGKSLIIKDLIAFLDVEEIEALSHAQNNPSAYNVHMKSGEKWDVSEEDFQEIKQILYSLRD